MFGDHERHRERKRIGCIQRPPAFVVDEREPAAPITLDLAHDPAVGDDDQRLGHLRSSLACVYDGIDVDEGHLVARPELAVAGLDRQSKVQGGEGAQHQAELGAGLAALDGHNPLPSDSRLAGEPGLAQPECSASVTDGQAEVQGGSYFAWLIRMSSNGNNVRYVVERRQMDIVFVRRLSGMSAPGHLSEDESAGATRLRLERRATFRPCDP